MPSLINIKSAAIRFRNCYEKAELLFLNNNSTWLCQQQKNVITAQKSGKKFVGPSTFFKKKPK
jgi:hypothetical protein